MERGFSLSKSPTVTYFNFDPKKYRWNIRNSSTETALCASKKKKNVNWTFNNEVLIVRYKRINNIRIPEHHWFYLYSTKGWSNFIIEHSSDDNKTSVEDEIFYKEMLIQKWTTSSAFLIKELNEFETYRHARNLWGVSPIDQHNWELAQFKKRGRWQEEKRKKPKKNVVALIKPWRSYTKAW